MGARGHCRARGRRYISLGVPKPHSNGFVFVYRVERLPNVRGPVQWSYPYPARVGRMRGPREGAHAVARRLMASRMLPLLLR